MTSNTTTRSSINKNVPFRVSPSTDEYRRKRTGLSRWPFKSLENSIRRWIFVPGRRNRATESDIPVRDGNEVSDRQLTNRGEWTRRPNGAALVSLQYFMTLSFVNLLLSYPFYLNLNSKKQFEIIANYLNSETPSYPYYEMEVLPCSISRYFSSFYVRKWHLNPS